MGIFRFNKRIKVLPGVSVNIGKKGVSTSIGPRGAKITLGHNQTRITTGIPGTGLSHTTITPNKPQPLQIMAREEDMPTPVRSPKPRAIKFGRILGSFFRGLFR